jgi:hypothetical protein
MFVFGHAGIGRTLAAPLARGLPDRWFFLGALLPDLIDKPLYYGLAWITGNYGADAGLISGTRTIGHTGTLMLALTVLSVVLKNRALAAMALGSATHLLLDAFMDFWSGGNPWANGVVVAILFPGAGVRFPVTPHTGANEHAWSLLRPEILATEAVGALLIGWHLWKHRHESMVVRDARAFASAMRKRLRFRRRRVAEE